MISDWGSVKGGPIEQVSGKINVRANSPCLPGSFKERFWVPGLFFYTRICSEGADCHNATSTFLSGDTNVGI